MCQAVVCPGFRLGCDKGSLTISARHSKPLSVKPCAAGQLRLDALPQLAEQWHPTKNNALKPSDVPVGSQHKAWWCCTACPCSQVHEWPAEVYLRASRQQGCPVCTGKRPCSCNSLAALRPDISAGWDAEGNEGLQPQQVLVSSGKKALWVCHKHQPAFSWAAAIRDRTRPNRPTGCPECARMTRKLRQRECLCSSLLASAATLYPGNKSKASCLQLCMRSLGSVLALPSSISSTHRAVCTAAKGLPLPSRLCKQASEMRLQAYLWSCLPHLH